MATSFPLATVNPVTIPTPTTRVLSFLNVSLHVLVAALLAVGIVEAWGSALPICLAGLFAVLYLVGTVLYHRGRRFSRKAVAGWLAAVLVSWAAMSCASPGFVWLLFPLVMLIIFLVPGGRGLGIAAVALLFTLAVTNRDPGGMGAVVGPTIGAVIAVIIVRAYQALRQEARHYRELVDRLAATQLELAASEREAGALGERQRLSREIHDTMAQGLNSIFLIARSAEAALGRVDSRDAAELGKALATIRDTAQENLAEARRFVADAAAPESLPQRITTLAETIRSRQEAIGHPLELHLSLTELDGRLPTRAADAAERVVREGLSNVVRHSGARRAVVSIARVGEELTIDVFDDGHGFDATSLEASGFGLDGLRARVAEIGGRIDVESSSDGTVVAAVLPLSGRRIGNNGHHEER